MPGRRRFVRELAGATAGVLFLGGRPQSALGRRSQSPAPVRRRQVTIGGRRVRTVDAHAHCTVPEAAELMGRKTAPDAPLLFGAERLRAMDEQGIDVQVLSINPFWYGAARDLARDVVDLQNRRLAELCAVQPDRFVPLATVALQHPDLAADQLEHAVRRLGMHGVSLGGSIESEELASRRFDPFWAKAEELGALVFVHPQGVPELRTRLQGYGVLGNVIGNPLETTIALSHLIFEGTFDRFPGLKVCAAHGGGYLPSYGARSDHGCLVFPEQCKGMKLAKKPTEYLKQIYVDSLVFTPESLRHLIATCGVGQIVLGTDYPFPWTTTAVDHVIGTPGLSDRDRTAILGGTLSTLLKITA